MQRLEEIDELTFTGYELQVLDNKEILLLNNEEIKRRLMNDSVEVTRENNVTTTIYNPKRPEKIVVEDGELTKEERFEYSNEGVLKRRINLVNGEVVSITSYDYSSSSGLTAFWVNDYQNPYYASANSYTFLDGDESTNISMISNVMVKKRDGVTANQNGDNIIIRDGNEEITYALNGDVLKRVIYDGDSISSSNEYFYSSGSLAKEINISGNTKKISEYSDRETVITTYDSDNIKARRVISDEGIFETVYRNGKEYALVRYYSDGKRALEVKVL